MIKVTPEHCMAGICVKFLIMNNINVPYEITAYQSQADFVFADYSTTHFTSILIMREFKHDNLSVVLSSL